MATPVVEQIALKIKTRIEAVSSVTKCVRPRRLYYDLASMEDHDAVLIQGDATPAVSINDGSYPATAIDWNQEWLIGLILRTDETDTTPTDTLANTFVADVIKGIATPSSDDWAQWDGLAITSEFTEQTIEEIEDAAIVLATLTLQVRVRLDETDPYTQR